MDANAFQDGANRATGDNTGTGSSRTQQDDAGSGLALYAVRNGLAHQGDAEEGLLGLFNTLGNGGRNFLGLAVADANQAVAVTNDDERGEAEATTTLDNLGNTVDVDYALDELALFSLASTVATTATATVATAFAASTSTVATATATGVIGACSSLGLRGCTVSCSCF